MFGGEKFQAEEKRNSISIALAKVRIYGRHTLAPMTFFASQTFRGDVALQPQAVPTHTTPLFFTKYCK